MRESILRTVSALFALAVVTTVVVVFADPLRAQAPPAQSQSGPRPAANLFLVTAGPETRAVNGKVVLWTQEELVKPRPPGLNHIQWAPQYRMTMQTRAAVAPGAEPTNGELHENDTQIYIVTGGSGTVLVEGTVAKDNDYLVAPSEHRGGPMTGGRKIRIKTGDVLSIPPFTWHQAYGDSNQSLSFLMVHVHTPQTIP